MFRPALTFLFLLSSSLLLAQEKSDKVMDDFYKLGPDSMKQEGVPTGKVDGPFFIKTDIYPNTQRKYCVYVPAQYDPKKPARLMVFQDGHAFLDPKGDVRATNVIDNLIYRREIPVMIAVFINPGRTPDQPEPPDQELGRPQHQPRPSSTTRSTTSTPASSSTNCCPSSKKEYNISDNPDHRGIGGASSGAIAAFTVAWERPDQFRKVLSTSAASPTSAAATCTRTSFASEKKPIRVYFQDGRNDNRGSASRRQVRREVGLVRPERPSSSRP